VTEGFAEKAAVTVVLAIAAALMASACWAQGSAVMADALGEGSVMRPVAD